MQGSVVGSKEKCSSKFEEAKSDMNFCMSLSVLNNTQSKFTRLLWFELWVSGMRYTPKNVMSLRKNLAFLNSFKSKSIKNKIWYIKLSEQKKSN